MLILKKTLQLKSLTPLRLKETSFSEKIAANYQYFLLDVSAEDMLHLASPLREGQAETEYNSFVLHFNQNNHRQKKVEMMNNWFNRVLQIGTIHFTYQDEVYVTQVLHKLGIAQAMEFMNQVRALYKADTTTNDFIRYYSEVKQEFCKVVQNSEQDNVGKSTKTPHYFMQEEIYRHLATKELTHIVNEYDKNRQCRTITMTRENILLTEYLKMVNMIQVAQVRREAALETYQSMRSYPNYYENYIIPQAVIDEKSVMTQMVSAALLHLADMIYINLQRSVVEDKRQISQTWVKCRTSMYSSLTNLFLRFREKHVGTQWNMQEEYFNRGEQQYRESRSQFYKWEEQLLELFHSPHQEELAVQHLAKEEIATLIMQIQKAEWRLEEYYNFLQVSGQVYHQKKPQNNELSGMEEYLCHLQQIEQELQYPKKMKHEMAEFIQGEVLKIEKKQVEIFHNIIRKQLRLPESHLKKNDFNYKNAMSEQTLLHNDTLQEQEMEQTTTYAETMNERIVYADVMNERIDYADDVNERIDYADNVNERIDYADDVNERIVHADDVNERIVHVDNVNERIVHVDDVNERIVHADDVNERIVYADRVKEQTVHADGVKEQTIYADVMKEQTVYSDRVKEQTIYADAMKKQTVYADGVKEQTVYADGVKERIVYADGVKERIIHADGSKERIVYADGAKERIVYADAMKERIVHADAPNKRAVYEDAMKEQTVHADAMKEQTVYADAMKEQTVYADAMKEQTVYADAMKEQTVYADAMKEQTVYADAMKKQTVYADAMKEQTVHADAMNERTVHGDAMNEQTVYMDVMHEQIVHVNTMKEDVVHGGVMNEQTVYVDMTKEPTTHADTLKEETSVQENILRQAVTYEKLSLAQRFVQEEFVREQRTAYESLGEQEATLHKQSMVPKNTQNEHTIVFENKLSEQGTLAEQEQKITDNSHSNVKLEQTLAYTDVIHKHLIENKNKVLENTPLSEHDIWKGKIATEQSEEAAKAIAIEIEEEQDIQLKQFLDSVDAKNRMIQRTLQEQIPSSSKIQQVRVDKKAVIKNALRILEDPEGVLQEMIGLPSPMLSTDTDFQIKSRQMELQAAIEQVSQNTDFQDPQRFYEDIDPSSDLDFVHKLVFRGREEEPEDRIQQKKVNMEEQVKSIEETIEKHLKENVTQQVTHTVMEELKKELRHTGEKVIPKLIEQNLPSQMASISEMVYKKLERKLTEERKRRGY